MDPLVDRFGRRMEDLRISLTDRCNFRCIYCMPEGEMEWIPNEKILTFPEIVRLARLFVRLGIREIRLTGGEPTVRAGLPDLIRELSRLRADGLQSLSLTTNGFRLKTLARDLAEAGLTRINVSLDSLDRVKFFRMTRRDALDRVLAGLEELEKYPSVHPIKVNCVTIRGFTTEDDIVAFAHFARRKPYIVRFIEFMPLDADGNWRRELVLTGEEVRRIISERVMPLEPLPLDDPSSTARRYRFVDGIGEIGFINPVSEPFCATCNRVRLTADGQLRTCLFSIDETDLRTALRAGASDDDLIALIRQAVWAKEKKHRINEGEAFRRASRSMSQIGG